MSSAALSAGDAKAKPARFRDNGDGTITDRASGLVWERKCEGWILTSPFSRAKNPTCSDLHDFESRYERNGSASWLAQINAQGKKGYAGHADWRLPTVVELQSIVDYARHWTGGAGTGAIDPTFGPTGVNAAYSSATQAAGEGDDAWTVSFGSGEVRRDHGAAHLRAVRGGRPAKADWSDNRNGTLTDRRTGLTWEKKCSACGGLHDVGGKYTWEEVAAWLQKINVEKGKGLGGHRDWRIPTAAELASTVDYTRADDLEAVAAIEHPPLGPTASWYWSSTRAMNPEGFMWTVMRRGEVTPVGAANQLYVRAVRGGR